MKSTIWGPYGWNTLHWLAFTLDEKKLFLYHSIFQSLQTILPCPVCRTHYSKQTQVSFPISNIRNRHTAIHWVFHLHNSVNMMLKKHSLTFDQCMSLYFTPTRKPKFQVKHILTFLLCCYHDYIKTKNDSALEAFPQFLTNIMTVFPFEQEKTQAFIQQYPIRQKDQLGQWFPKLFQLFGLVYMDPLLKQPIQPMSIQKKEHVAETMQEVTLQNAYTRMMDPPVKTHTPPPKTKEPWSDISIDDVLRAHEKQNENPFM